MQNHPLITWLIGAGAAGDERVVIRPLPPAGQWSYFAIDALPYHGHLLTVLWDATGQRYGKGKGMTLIVDGKRLARRADLGELNGKLP